jgi:histidinol-phosphatase (PHP family)
MITFDSHVHTSFSFDGDPSASPDAVLHSAIQKGITHLAITDHLELNAIAENLPDMDYDASSAQKAILHLKEAGDLPLRLSFGIEMGQINQYPHLAEEYIRQYSYETILGSLHSLKGKPDFYFWDMAHISQEEFQEAWLNYLSEILEILEIGGFDVLTHLTYPLRYFCASGRSLDLSFDRNLLEKVLARVIDQKILLEVNSSGFRQGMNCPLPDDRVLRLYHDMGGELLSIGSDAHQSKDIAGDFSALEKYLLDLSFTEIHFKQNGVLFTENISTKETIL